MIRRNQGHHWWSSFRLMTRNHNGEAAICMMYGIIKSTSVSLPPLIDHGRNLITCNYLWTLCFHTAFMQRTIVLQWKKNLSFTDLISVRASLHQASVSMHSQHCEGCLRHSSHWQNGVASKWVATPFWSDSIVSIDFNESYVTSIITVLTLHWCGRLV